MLLRINIEYIFDGQRQNSIQIFNNLPSLPMLVRISGHSMCQSLAKRPTYRIPLYKLDENMLFYKADNLYDIVADAIGLMHSEACGNPIPYEFLSAKAD